MTYFNDPHIPRFQEPDYYENAGEQITCEICQEYYYEDDQYCQNPHCHCQECGEELPEVSDDAHCTKLL